ncbi:hypothetical protein UF37_16040 [Vibrio parahaemolyticus]|nr:hypothetical protein UF37_16040 [Vibrio parahaemolyticus]
MDLAFFALALCMPVLNNPHLYLRQAVKKELWGASPLATLAHELGQVGKKTAAPCDLCAGMWLGAHPLKAPLI